MIDIQDVELEGRYVILRPPTSDDLEGLCDAANDGEIWKNPFSIFPSISEMSVYLQNLIHHDNTILPFVIIEKKSMRLVGTTRFLNIDLKNRRVEIGHTWIAESFRRTVINTESKFLMLQYAFEKLHCIAVEIRADVLNKVSRKAIERLGAKQDGILRNHKIMKDGRIRNTVSYSIINEEWPDVRENLFAKLNIFKDKPTHLIFYLALLPFII
ncbi:MAG TPA: GNAT family protein [Candidatus Saccharimonadales bacterium]|nr:GNAT family protein [Candidatus Saccharimonadales bacterium]